MPPRGSLAVGLGVGLAVDVAVGVAVAVPVAVGVAVGVAVAVPWPPPSGNGRPPPLDGDVVAVGLVVAVGVAVVVAEPVGVGVLPPPRMPPSGSLLVGLAVGLTVVVAVLLGELLEATAAQEVEAPAGVPAATRAAPARTVATPMPALPKVTTARCFCRADSDTRGDSRHEAGSSQRFGTDPRTPA